MKKLLLGLILVASSIVVSCSKNDDENVSSEFDPVSYYMNKYDLSASDTIDLRMFGLCAMPDTNVLVLLGNKKGHLWIKFVEFMPYDKDGIDDIICKEIKQLEIQSQFNDIRKVELGYGEYEIDTIKYLELDEYDMLLGSDHYYHMCFHDYEHFAISKGLSKGAISWVICKDKIKDTKGYLAPLLNGYYSDENSERIYIYNEYGDLLYTTKYLYINTLSFINMYEYIKCDYDYENHDYEYKWRIRKINAEMDEVEWTYVIGEIGAEINGNQPKINYKIETSENYITCTFDCTNYDGTKEQKIVKLNMDGESID